MNKPKLTALLCALMLCLTAGAAAQQDTLASYIQPDGVELCEVGDLGGFSVPEGLQPMFTLMAKADPTASAYVFIMPHHRVLLSISSLYTPESGTAQDLLDHWEDIAAALSREADSVNTDGSCAVLETQYGFDALHVTTQLAFTGDTPLTVLAEGAAFYREDELLEVWAVQPDPAAYAQDAAAAAELEADLASLMELKENLTFDVSSVLDDADFMEGVAPYRDPEGRFDLSLPREAQIVTRDTPKEELDSLRESCFATKGWSDAFDQLSADVYDENATLVLMPEYGLIAQIFCDDDEDFRHYTVENYQGLAEPVRQSLEQRFGSASLLDSGSSMMVAGQEHAWFSYWLRTQETDMMLSLFAATDSSGLLRELDLFFMMDEQIDPAWREKAMELILETIQYNAPASTGEPA